MADIRPSEISEILKNEIKGFEGQISVRETGRVLSCGDGIARIYGLRQRGLGRVARIPASDLRDGAQPRRGQRRRRAVRRSAGDPRGRRGQAHRPHRRSAGRRRAARARRQRAGPADRRQGTDQDRPRRGGSRSRRPASSTASRSRSRCRPGSRRSTRCSRSAAVSAS